MIIWAVAYAVVAGMAFASIIWMMHSVTYHFRNHFLCALMFMGVMSIITVFPTIAIQLIQTEIDARGQNYVVIHKMITFKDCALVDMKTMECIK